MSVIGSVRAKGVAAYASRAGMILARFGPTPRQMDQALRRYVEITDAYGVRPSLPVTATVLARHPDLIRAYAARGVEFAIHGMVHGDHHGLSYDEQRQSLVQADSLFKAAGIPYAGFRAPYLRYNRDTDRALRHLRFRYHSSQAVAFPVLENLDSGGEAAYRRALTYYEAQDAASVAVRPREADGLIHLPVAIPDDEIMVDRLHLDDQVQARAWLAIFEQTYRRGELFTVQLHPERIFHSGQALTTVLDAARRRAPAVWMATLDDIASWWIRRRETRLEVVGIGRDRYRVQLHGDSRATLTSHNLAGVSSEPWYGDEHVLSSSSFEMTSRRKPVVGLSLGSPLPLREFLHEEGFLTEITDDAASVGAYLQVDGKDWQEQAVLETVGRGAGPLVRLARWPQAARSALAVTGDIDSITLQDFGRRLLETSAPERRRRLRRWSAAERQAVFP